MRKSGQAKLKEGKRRNRSRKEAAQDPRPGRRSRAVGAGVARNRIINLQDNGLQEAAGRCPNATWHALLLKQHPPPTPPVFSTRTRAPGLLVSTRRGRSSESLPPPPPERSQNVALQNISAAPCQGTLQELQRPLEKRKGEKIREPLALPAYLRRHYFHPICNSV